MQGGPTSSTHPGSEDGGPPELSAGVSVSAETARRTVVLLQITAALADAVTSEDVVVAVVDQTGAALGAVAAALWLVDSERSMATMVRALGYLEPEKAAFATVTLGSRVRVPILDVIETGTPIWIDSRAQLLELYPDLASVPDDRPSRSACLPMTIDDRIIGALALTFADGDAFGDEDRSFLLDVARHCAQAVERIRQLREARRAQVETELLFRLTEAVNKAPSLDAVYDISQDTIRRALGVERAAILVHDSDGVMRFKSWRGLSERYRTAVEGHTPWSRDEKNAQPILIGDVQIDADLAPYRAVFAAEHIGALAFVPLSYQSQLLGKFMLYWSEPHAFAEREIKTARHIADQVAVAIGWRLAQQVQERLIAELSETVRLNQLFVGVVGHDLRNPLGAVLTTASYILRSEAGQTLVRPLDRIIASGERMGRIIDQLLDFTRIRSGGGIPCEPRRMDLASVCRQVLDELENVRPDRQVVFEVDGDSTGQWDPDRLGQVVSNLVSNAIQHGTNDGPVIVRIDGNKPETVFLRVWNSGTVPADMSSTMFDPFRGAEQRWARTQGLGLGLYITQQIAQAHGGTVDATTSEEAGTTFTVTLPRNVRIPELSATTAPVSRNADLSRKDTKLND